MKDAFQFYVSATVTPADEGYTITTHTYYSTAKTELVYEVSRYVELIFSSKFSSQLSYIAEFLTNKSLSQGFEFTADAIKMAGFALLRAGYELQSRTE